MGDLFDEFLMDMDELIRKQGLTIGSVPAEKPDDIEPATRPGRPAQEGV